jgi:hypothetical protein
MPKKSPEMIKMLGGRELDNDGYGYPYGKHKSGSKKPRHNNVVDVSRRNDKRSVRQAEIKREENEA